MTMTSETRPNEMTRASSAPLAPRGQVMPTLITDEHRTILRQMVDRNATPAQVEMLIVVGNRYDLDPLMGHVVLINGKCFVTHKGLMHKAHASGAFDGIETQYGQDGLGEYCECSVWRKDMSRPFSGRIYIDEYRTAGPVWKQYPRAMAAKTAELFVLRRAFDVSLTSQEEMGVDRTVESDPPPCPGSASRPGLRAAGRRGPPLLLSITLPKGNPQASPQARLPKGNPPKPRPAARSAASR